MRVKGEHMKRISLVILAAIVVSIVACDLSRSEEYQYLPVVGKYKVCENEAGRGFFWVDTTSGKTWWADPQKKKWVSYGQPKGAKPARVGTYIPCEDKSGKGVFVLNTATGQGWWTNGKEWKELGKLEDK